MEYYKIKKEIKTDHASPIPESASDKIYNSIVKIKIKGGFGTGFLMKIKIKNEELRFLFTCYHIISKRRIDSNEVISIIYGKKNKEEKKYIELNKNERFIKTFGDQIDVSIIEILDEDGISDDKFLFPDLNYKYGFDLYTNKDIFLAGYYPNEERAICSGKLKKIKDYKIFHTIETGEGSSGSPIILKDNIYVIGIHIGGIEKNKINIGTVIGFILDSLEKENINIGYIHFLSQKFEKQKNIAYMFGVTLRKIKNYIDSKDALNKTYGIDEPIYDLLNDLNNTIQ